ncbi:hypothetical protein V1522DRAFT_75265 [Lipomyces starkeyi]
MCGICGILLADQKAMCASQLLESLHFLQHRGQDAAGIVTCGPRGRLYQCKGNVRYPTAGSSANSEAQPFYVNSPYGIILSHVCLLATWLLACCKEWV